MTEFDFNPDDYQAPHCNMEVLHAPGVCRVCDKYPQRQQGRIVSNTPFSPAEQPWPGNSPNGYADMYGRREELRDLAPKANEKHGLPGLMQRISQQLRNW